MQLSLIDRLRKLARKYKSQTYGGVLRDPHTDLELCLILLPQPPECSGKGHMIKYSVSYSFVCIYCLRDAFLFLLVISMLVYDRVVTVPAGT